MSEPTVWTEIHARAKACHLAICPGCDPGAAARCVASQCSAWQWSDKITVVERKWLRQKEADIFVAEHPDWFFGGVMEDRHEVYRLGDPLGFCGRLMAK